jgi:large subunit ribosomal protein L6e
VCSASCFLIFLFFSQGVPLRRVNASYVIATSTHVDVAGLKLRPELLSDAFYKAAKAAKPKKAAGAKEFTADKNKKAPLSPERQATQKEVDAQLLASIKKVPLLSAYLRKPFSLSNGQQPHNMRF